MKNKLVRVYFPIICVILLFSLFFPSAVKAVLISIKISGSLTPGGEVESYQVSPDGEYAVFMADAVNYAIMDLFSVPAAGGERIRLSSGTTGENMVQGFIISPNSEYVVYWVGEPEEYGHTQCIYVVPIGGGTPLVLVDEITEDFYVEDISITSNNLYVVYQLMRAAGSSSCGELWLVPLSGGTPVSYHTCANEVFIQFKLSPDGSYIIYKRDGNSVNAQLFKANFTGASTLLLEVIIEIREFSITPDGTYVIFRGGESTDELYSIPTTGGSPIKLNTPLVSGQDVLDFQVSPSLTADYVVYRADEEVDELFELFSVPYNGAGDPIRLFGPTTDPTTDAQDYQITPNGLAVVYIADRSVDERFDLGAVAITGGTHYWLSKEMVAGGDVDHFKIGSDNQRVVFLADKLVYNRLELFVVSIFGENLTKLSEETEVKSFRIAPNNQYVIYEARPPAGTVFDLYFRAAGPSLKITNFTSSANTIIDYRITSDSLGLVYHANQDSETIDELFSIYDRFPIYLPLLLK